MADFSTANAGGPMGSNVTPARPVTSDSAGTVLNAIGSLARGAFDAFGDAQKLEAAKQEKSEELAGAKVLSAFRAEQLKYIDAYEQGAISQSEARTRMRAALNKYQSDNPLLGEDVLKTHSSIMATAGLGKVVDEGTEAAQERAKVRQAALDAGFLQDAEDEEAAVADYLRFKRAGESLQRQQAELNYENSKLERTGKLTSNESASISLTEKKIQLDQQKTVAEMADAFATPLRDKTTAILTRFQNGEIDSKTALAEVNGLRQTINTTITGGGRKAGSEFLSTTVAPLIETLDIAKEVISGNVEYTAATNQFNNNILRQKILMTNDPANAKVVALSEMLRNVDTLRAAEVDNAVTRMLGTMTDTNKDNFNPYTKEVKEAKVALDVLKDNLKALATGKKNPKLEAEMDAAMADVLSGVSAYKAAATDTAQLKNVQDFLADPLVASYINTRGGVPKEVVTNAKEAVQELYEMRVLPAIETQLKQSNVVSGFKSTGQGVLGGEVTTTPASNVVTMKFAGSDVYFEASDSTGRTKAKELNQKLAPVMNKAIKISAHLNGGTDYKGAYERLFADMVQGEAVSDKGNP